MCSFLIRTLLEKRLKEIADSQQTRKKRKKKKPVLKIRIKKMLVYNLLNNYLHCPELQDKIVQKTPNPRLRNNQIGPFVVPHPKFTKLHESPLNRAMTICNNLTLNINEFSLPKDMFKSKCIEYIKQNNI
uniref:Uncharacterized protein n=1 Tax=Cacopsylla melanoneura TaxID=428564 RepID=A0A8D9FK15_9HEMI